MKTLIDEITERDDVQKVDASAVFMLRPIAAGMTLAGVFHPYMPSGARVFADVASRTVFVAFPKDRRR